MVKHSAVLSYLLSRAEELLHADDRRTLTSNYFFLSLLKTLRELRENTLCGELRTEACIDELNAARDELLRYGVCMEEAETTLLSRMREGRSKYSSEEIGFSKIRFVAQLQARQKDLSVVDTAVYLEQILKEPTAAIRSLFSNGIETVSEPSVAEMLAEIEKDAADAADAADAPTEGAMQDSEEPINNGGQLAQIVRSTRRVQDMLLRQVYGQDQAVSAFVSGYFQSRLMTCSREETRKPQATFLFAGPPGVGKTFLAETAAEALGLPYRRFDMSEYADKEANIEFCGSDKVYKNGKAGNVTSFVAANPRCVLLFDEIEKAHINVIYLFLQILDAGRIRDNYTDEEVSFSHAVIIFTTNAGKNLYDDPSIVTLSAVPRKKVLKALATDVDPMTGAPLFPAAICSRFASGNVVMFNHLEASNLFKIAKNELQNNVEGMEKATGIQIQIDDNVPGAIMFSEGGRADARTVKGRANAFFYEELYELLRLMSSDEGAEAVERLKSIRVFVPMEGMDAEVRSMFSPTHTPEVLVFAEGAAAESMARRLAGRVVCHAVSGVAEAKEVLFRHDIDVVLCDVRCGTRGRATDVLNVVDIDSEGHDFLSYVLDAHSLAVYLVQPHEGDISNEELLSFAELGVRDVLSVDTSEDTFTDEVLERCRVAYLQSSMLKLAKENRALSYKTSQSVSRDGTSATVQLFGFRRTLIADTQDAKNIVDNVSRPDLHFDDVIGAEDAKGELRYFVEYLKNPKEFLRKGVRPPRGVLLYGPPGTGKTMLAKAVAGECGVTFLRAEGNEFLKRFVGEGAEAVHALFRSARKYAPSIIFVDEIDAIGKDRNTSGELTSDVLTAFLTEMDGFHTDTDKPIFVLAATNYGVDAERGKSLDAALLRRFDRRIYVDLPNKEERRRYLSMRIQRTPTVMLSDEQLDNIAVRSTGMSLAELESVVEMALRGAIRSASGTVGDEAFEEAFETFQSGEKKEWSPDALERTARHEAGHALICYLGGETPTYLTVVARGDHGGYMQHAGHEDKATYTRPELLHRICTALGGRAAEIVYYGEEDGLSTGASGDLHTATSVAEHMVCCYGMDASVGLSYVEATSIDAAYAARVRHTVNELLAEQMIRAVTLVKEHRTAIDAMVKALLEKNHLKEHEITEIFDKAVKRNAQKTT